MDGRSSRPLVRTVAEDGASLEFTVPAEARTGIASILSGGSGKLLQIVPRVSAVDSGGGKGQPTFISGSGFIEGNTTVRFGAVQVVDGGTGSGDGIDVFGSAMENDRLVVTVPSDGTLPYEVITDGGRSGRANDVSKIVSTTATGTPANGAEASANVGQKVRVEGAGFSKDLTKITLEGTRSDGRPFITTVSADSR